MSLFGTIMSKILGHPVAAAAAPADASAPAPVTDTTATSAPDAAAAPGSATPASATPASATPTVPAGPPVDVEAVLSGMAPPGGEKLNWQQSIVDLMKLLGMDSSLTARKELATELHYTGNQDDSATMNVWLHKQIMQKLAENGGKLPAGL